MKENSKGKDLLKILQENYEIETAQDLSGAIKDLFRSEERRVGKECRL